MLSPASRLLVGTILLPSERIISPLSTRLLRMQVTLVGALSASSTTRMLPVLAACTSGLSSYTITPSRTVGCRVRVCTVVSLQIFLQHNIHKKYSGKSVHLFSWMYSLGLLRRFSILSTSLFLPVPWLPTSSMCSPSRKSCSIASISVRFCGVS